MNICEAMAISKATGASFTLHGWAKYDPKHTYKFSAAELLSDDWEPTSASDVVLVDNFLADRYEVPDPNNLDSVEKFAKQLTAELTTALDTFLERVDELEPGDVEIHPNMILPAVSALLCTAIARFARDQDDPESYMFETLGRTLGPIPTLVCMQVFGTDTPPWQGT